MIHEETLVTPQKQKEALEEECFDLVIIGAGPAGMSAALCAGRSDLKTLLIERTLPGGQTSTAYLVDNYLGFPKGLLGEELGKKMEDHLFNYSIQYARENVLDVEKIGMKETIVKTDMGSSYKTKALLIAIGLEPKTLDAPFETKYLGRGISYYAQCDANFYRGMDVAVIGGGNCACYAAEYLSSYVNTLYLIHRSDSIKAVKSLKQRVLNNPKIEVMWNSEVVDVFGIDKIEKIKIHNIQTHQHTWLNSKGLFVYTGRIPPREKFLDTLSQDEKGFIITDEYMRTSIPGIYAAGDIRCKQIRQIATAVSDGMIAAINIERDLSRNSFPIKL